MNRSYLEAGSIKTRQFSNSETPVPPLPPQSVSDCKGFESHYPFKVITASLITAGHWSLQRLFAKAKFAGSDQQIHSMSVAPASSWVSRGKPQHLAARAPHGLKRLFVARCEKKKNQVFNNSADSNWFIFICSLLLDPATLNTQQRNAWIMRYTQGWAGERIGRCTPHLQGDNRAFYYKCLCTVTQKPVLEGFFWIS